LLPRFGCRDAALPFMAFDGTHTHLTSSLRSAVFSVKCGILLRP
jgi:hypothetical protein